MRIDTSHVQSIPIADCLLGGIYLKSVVACLKLGISGYVTPGYHNYTLVPEKGLQLCAPKLKINANKIRANLDRWCSAVRLSLSSSLCI